MEFNWEKNEANFGLPADKEIDGGTHFTIEIILQYNGKLIMVRRPEGYPGHQLPPKAEKYPEGCLYFCHDLPRWGETLDYSVQRIVKGQIGVEIVNLKVVDLEMQKYPDEQHEGNKQWAITLYVKVEINELPKLNDKVTEVVEIDSNNLPGDMGWWEAEELKEYID